MNNENIERIININYLIIISKVLPKVEVILLF